MSFATAIKGKLSGLSFRRSGDEGAIAAASPSALKTYMGKGLFAGFSLFFLFVVWMFLRGPDTAMKVQHLLPSHTVVIGESADKPLQESVAEEESSKNQPAAKTLANGRQIVPLPPAPMEGLFETVGGKILPLVRMTDDLTPFAAYKKPHQAIQGRPQVGFVIIDYGLSDKLAESMIKNLPPEITFVLSPYASDPSKWAAVARAYGHEFWLSLPMQTQDASGIDSGPDAIDAKDTLENNTAKALRILSAAPGYAGVVTTGNHVMLDSDISVKQVLTQIFGRGLAIAESNPDRAAWGLTTAMQNGYPYVQNNYWLGTDLRPDAIQRTLRDIEGQATRKGKVIVFLPPYPLLINRVMDWSENAEANGFQLAPLSSMVAR